MALNPYEILGLQVNCTDKEIKEAYKMAAKKHHPDKGGDGKQFALVKLAYDTLKDKDKRKKFGDQGFMDGDTSMEKTQKAMELLTELFFNILQNSNPDQIDTLDLIGSLKANIDKKISELEQSIEHLKQAEIRQKRALKSLKKRLKRKGDKPNMLLIALESSILSIPAHIISLKDQIKIQKEMYTMANEYNYEFENMNYSFSAGVSAWSWSR